MSRAILIDTETTGLDPGLGHRVIEVAAIELINDLPSGRHFHALIDPERDVDPEAAVVHGFTTAMLRGKPRFAEIAPALVDFLGEATLIAHNAGFDAAFLNTEFARVPLPPVDSDRFVDTLALAKTRFPGVPNSLDALCRRFAIDLSARTTHNALLDCRLLAQVYLELIGGRQHGLTLIAATASERLLVAYAAPTSRTPRLIEVSAAEASAHARFVAGLEGSLWGAG
jgi:DNA polymerase-3 subunit epsilon